MENHKEPEPTVVGGCAVLVYIAIGIFTSVHSYDWIISMSYHRHMLTVGDWVSVKCVQVLFGLGWPLYWLGKLLEIPL